jgi:hypothetical protein
MPFPSNLKNGPNHEYEKRERLVATPHLTRLIAYPLKRQEGTLSCHAAE